jgi:tRNA A37 methylthiotransferase MiaB
LRAAITDKLPDAEVKSRLERLREVRKQNEAKVAKAQEELRAVLSVRQEAVAVMFGLLP